MSKTSTRSTTHPFFYGPGMPITTQRLKALNQMATWLSAEVTYSLVNFYAGNPTMDGSMEGLNLTFDSTNPTTWKTVGYYIINANAEDTSRIKFTAVADLTASSFTSLGYRSAINVKVNSTDNIVSFGTNDGAWLSYQTLSGFTEGVNAVQIDLMYNHAGSATGSGDDYFGQHLSGLTIVTARLTGSYPDVL